MWPSSAGITLRCCAAWPVSCRSISFEIENPERNGHELAVGIRLLLPVSVRRLTSRPLSATDTARDSRVGSHPEAIAARTRRRVTGRLIPYLMFLYLLAYIDRSNLAVAKLQMQEELNFTDAIIGFGAGIFFFGYLLLDIPGSLIVERWSARKWSCGTLHFRILKNCDGTVRNRAVIFGCLHDAGRRARLLPSRSDLHPTGLSATMKPRKILEDLRSYRWFAPDTMRSFSHCSRLRQCEGSVCWCRMRKWTGGGHSGFRRPPERVAGILLCTRNASRRRTKAVILISWSGAARRPNRRFIETAFDRSG